MGDVGVTDEDLGVVADRFIIDVPQESKISFASVPPIVVIMHVTCGSRKASWIRWRRTEPFGGMSRRYWKEVLESILF